MIRSVIGAVALLLLTSIFGNPPMWAAHAAQACGNAVIYDNTTVNSTQLLALSSTNGIYICGYSIFAGGTANVDLRYGTGTNCATGATKITPAYQLTAQTGIVDGASEFRGLYVPTGKALCINSSVGIAVQVIVYY